MIQQLLKNQNILLEQNQEASHGQILTMIMILTFLYPANLITIPSEKYSIITERNITQYLTVQQTYNLIAMQTLFSFPGIKQLI